MGTANIWVTQTVNVNIIQVIYSTLVFHIRLELLSDLGLSACHSLPFRGTQEATDKYIFDPAARLTDSFTLIFYLKTWKHHTPIKLFMR